MFLAEEEEEEEEEVESRRVEGDFDASGLNNPVLFCRE